MSARFDTALMAPPNPQPVADPALLACVRAWCEQDAFPRLTQPLAAATLAPHAGLDGVACELDGSHALARRGRLRGLAWRVQLLLQERWPGRAPDPADPWDCGWWRGDLAAARAFRPRRATLLLVQEAQAAQAPALLQALAQRPQANRPRPLRVLVLSSQPQPPPDLSRLSCSTMRAV